MEQHPVPQNVTTFQFRLIGDMTVKQFGYLAGGLILAYISYKLPLPFFFTWPLALFFGLGGFGFAFVPVEERPMDVWVLSFLKNVYSPTQYLWQKQKREEAPLDVVSRRVATRKTTKPAIPTPPHAPNPPAGGPTRTVATPQVGFFSNLIKLFSLKRQQAPVAPLPVSPPIHTALRPRGRTLLLAEWFVEPSQWLAALVKTFSPKKPPIPPTPPGIFNPVNTSALTGKRVDLTSTPLTQTQQTIAPLAHEIEEKKALEHRLSDLQRELATKTATDARLKELQEQIAQALSDKAKMEQELANLRRQLTTQAKPQQGVVRPAGVTEQQSPSATVRVVTADMAAKIGLPRLTTFPNVITGILKDSSGNLLSGILVTVRDRDDIPVRALKANKIGQFAASTPLPNGTYTIDIEDPREQFIFDRIALTLTGELLPAVEVTAKNQKQVAREKLAAEIFGQPKM